MVFFYILNTFYPALLQQTAAAPAQVRIPGFFTIRALSRKACLLQARTI